jgi:hypothetical protein
MHRVTHCLLGTALFGLLMIDGWGCAAYTNGSVKDLPEKDWTLRLVPDAELADVVEDWAERWSAATGRTILVGTDGTPVVAVDEIPDETSPFGYDCGATLSTFHGLSGQWIAAEWMQIDTTAPVACPAWEQTVAHEMAHALSACGHTTVEGSLMQPSVDKRVTHVIDEAALELVCATSECTTFAPETPQ